MIDPEEQTYATIVNNENETTSYATVSDEPQATPVFESSQKVEVDEY